MAKHPTTGPIGKFLREHIDACGKTQKEIADEIGYDKPNMITMLKQEKTRVPLAKAGLLARALGADPVEFLKLLLSVYVPDTLAAITEVFDVLSLSPNERELIEAYRRATVGRTAKLEEILPAVVVIVGPAEAKVKAPATA